MWYDLSEVGGGTPVPEAWIGRAVELIFVSRGSTEYVDGVLGEVNDRGVVLSVETYLGRPARPLFYPPERSHPALRDAERMRGRNRIP